MTPEVFLASRYYMHMSSFFVGVSFNFTSTGLWRKQQNG